MALESGFQSKLIRELKKMFPGCMVMKTDPSYIQGLPDLLILYGDKWATLECKKATESTLLCGQNGQDVFLSFYLSRK